MQRGAGRYLPAPRFCLRGLSVIQAALVLRNASAKADFDYRAAAPRAKYALLCPAQAVYRTGYLIFGRKVDF